MKIFACEESQAITKSFRGKGHEAFSCDLQECSGGHPEWHYKQDIFQLLEDSHLSIDFLGGNPPCTYSANSGVRWLYNRDGSTNKERWIKMREGALFTKALLGWVKAIGRGFIEQPILHKYALEIIGERPTQIIQPWQFGHGETKATCLWVIGLPNLRPTNIVDGREQRIWKLPPSPERQKLRSKTYQGIADAMADQWGGDYYTQLSLAI